MSRPAFLSAWLQRRRHNRAFTLVELMVAITGGLAVSVMVFALAKDGSRFYKSESGVADATLAATIGFDRLRNDIARAGFLSSPNIFRDPLFCGDTTSIPGWAGVDLLRSLSSLQISDDPDEPNEPTEKGGKGIIRIQQLLLSGAYDSVDRFPVVDVRVAGGASGGYEVVLQTQIGALARMRFSTVTNQTALLATLFPPGRALRLVSDTGQYQFGRITEAKVDDGAAIIVLGAQPPLVLPGGSANPCSVRGTGTLVNVVNFIRYRLADMSDSPDYAALFGTPQTLISEAGPRELVREELDVNATVLSTEIIAEYAVDLRFGVTMVRNAPLTGPATQLQTFPIVEATEEASTSASDIVDLLAPVTLAGTSRPQHARAVRVRLGIRGRNPDRHANVAIGTDVAPGLYRMYLGTQDGRDHYARVRTLQSDVVIPAHQEITWQ
jgi:hypothetical protein